jgi:hypothetical protein
MLAQLCKDYNNGTFMPMRFLSSCSGSAAHVRKVTTSFAIWLTVAGVPVRWQGNFERPTQKHQMDLIPSSYSICPS